MKLYMHPLSTTSRPLLLFIADNDIEIEQQVVDLFAGEHYKEPFASLNPNRMLPVLEDGDLRLTESSAILKYLADKIGSPAYPKDLKQRAKVNEMLDWLNTQLTRDWGYGLCYPQLFPHHKRRSEEAQAATIEWGAQNAEKWLHILNDHWLGPNRRYLCGDDITIADYLGAALVSVGEIIRYDFSKYPNVQRWLDNVKKRPNWAKVNESFYNWRDAVKGQAFQTV
jgi:glutathione S-transferase